MIKITKIIKRPPNKTDGNDKIKWDYSLPIKSLEHAAFCREHAALRHAGILTTDRQGKLCVRKGNDQLVYDPVLDEVSNYEREAKRRRKVK